MAETISAIPKPTSSAAISKLTWQVFEQEGAVQAGHTEKGDDNPTNGHNTRSTCIEAILK